MHKHREKFVNKNQEIIALSQEVHHRVKNNLALLTSLLELERDSREMDPEYEELLRHTNVKIRTISVIHELLYQQNAYSRIDLDRFLKEFNERVIAFLCDDDPVKMELQFDNKGRIEVDIKYAIPIALFLYECVVFTRRDEVAQLSRLLIDIYKTDSNLYLSCHFKSEDKVPAIDLEGSDLLELELARTLLTQLESFWKVEYDESEAVIYVDIPMQQNSE